MLDKQIDLLRMGRVCGIQGKITKNGRNGLWLKRIGDCGINESKSLMLKTKDFCSDDE